MGARCFMVIMVPSARGTLQTSTIRSKPCFCVTPESRQTACSGMCEMMLASMRTWGLTMAQFLSLLNGWRRSLELDPVTVPLRIHALQMGAGRQRGGWELVLARGID